MRDAPVTPELTEQHVVIVPLGDRDWALLLVVADLLRASPDACARGLLTARLEGLAQQLAVVFGPRGEGGADA